MAENAKSFECLRCGRCCTNLVAKDRGILRGLTLLPDERTLFYEDVVKPAIGVGRSPHKGYFRIIAYQMTEDACPHLEGQSCAAYQARPASCRQFPFSVSKGQDGNTQMGFDLNCPALLALFSEGQKPRIGFDEWPSAKKLLWVQTEVASRPDWAWYFDLGTGKWIGHESLPDR